MDYELNPREYHLCVAQTVLRVHTRVADLYNDPMNQFEEQLRLTSRRSANARSGSCSTTASSGCCTTPTYEQRINTWSGPPTPDDLDDLVSHAPRTRLLLAHPKASPPSSASATSAA